MHASLTPTPGWGGGGESVNPGLGEARKSGVTSAGCASRKRHKGGGRSKRRRGVRSEVRTRAEKKAQELRVLFSARRCTAREGKRNEGRGWAGAGKGKRGLVWEGCFRVSVPGSVPGVGARGLLRPWQGARELERFPVGQLTCFKAARQLETWKHRDSHFPRYLSTRRGAGMRLLPNISGHSDFAAEERVPSCVSPSY